MSTAEQAPKTLEEVRARRGVEAAARLAARKALYETVRTDSGFVPTQAAREISAATHEVRIPVDISQATHPVNIDVMTN